jgi:UDP-N-acetylmuramoyl-tripeptide--D-alanyl-D-alanine ligase
MSIKSYLKKKLEKIFANQTNKIVKKHKPMVIAVTGSVGKTSTKHAIATILAEKYRVQFQEGNYNTEISVPFIFLGRPLPNLYNPFGWYGAWLQGQKILRNGLDYDVVVVEIGTDYPGDVIKFKTFLRPTISVVTAVSEEHMEFFPDLEAVAKEELSIANFSDSLLVNADDIAEEYLEKYIPRNVELHSYGFKHSEYKLAVLKDEKQVMKFSVLLGSGQELHAKAKVLAEHSLKPIAGAIAVADLLGLNEQQIQRGIQTFKPVPGRMQVLNGLKNSVIIDDSYNSSPLACKAALDALYKQDAPQRIAILGMMNELGNFSEAAHREIGEYCDPKKLDLVVTVGKDAKTILADTAEAKGCHVARCDSPYQAGKLVAERLKENGVVLAKGSQNGVFTEEAIKQLLADGGDVFKLVRQSDFWMAKKRAQFADAE